jgi:hypothetical protein
METIKHKLHSLAGKLFPQTSNKQRKLTGALYTTLIRLAHNKSLRVVAFSICCLPSAAYANAHCFCKLGPPSAPIRDFGQIATYNTQIGHDSSCSSLCNATIDSYMNDAANHASACSTANGASIVTYSAVGTRPYQAGKAYTCPQTNPAPVPGSMRFVPPLYFTRVIYVNGLSVNPYAAPPSLNVPIQTPFTTFKLEDHLNFHAQRWTYDATLYRDNVLVERFSGKSPPASSASVLVQFTGQPNSSVHGHTWKIEWHYNGNQFSNGSTSFFIQ